MSGLKILASSIALPSKWVSNAEMEKLVDTSDEWISSRTGIKGRYFCTGDESGLTLAIKAAEEVVAKADVQKEQIGAIVVATFTARYATPSTACLVQQALELPEQTLCLDVNAACSGFLYALETARALLVGSDKPYALVVATEEVSRVVDFNDRSTCVLFGDGAGAVVTTLSDENEYFFTAGAKGTAEPLYVLNRDDGDGFIHMDGQAVFRFAVEAITDCVTRILDKSGKSMEDIYKVVCHQANKRIIDSAAKKLKISEDKLFKNLHKYGNTSCASIPIAFHELMTQEEIPAGSQIICVGFGAGLTYGATLLTV